MAPRRGQTKDPTRGEYGFSGVSISGLIQAMRDHRLDANLLRGVSADQLARWTATAPVIAKVSDGRSWNHVVVVDGVEGDQVKLRDPAAGKLKVPISRFEQVFTGQVVRASARPGVSYPQATSRDAKQKRIVDLLTLVDCGYKQSPSWPAVSGPWNRLRQEGRLDWAVQLAP